MSWSDPIIDGADWSNVSSSGILYMLAKALNDRGRVGAYDTVDRFPLPTTGTDLQNYTILHALQEQTIVILDWFIKPILPSGTSTLYNPGTWGITSDAPLNRSIRQVREHYSWPITHYYDNRVNNPPTEIVTARNGLFRRKRPREIISITDTFDIQGNPALSGQHAYRISATNSLSNPYTGDTGTGQVYAYNGSVWSPDNTGARVDILDNTLSPPNCISQGNRYMNLGGEVFQAGTLIPGDYIGAWIFEEVRLAIDLCRWTYISNPTSIAANSFRRMADPTIPTGGNLLFATDGTPTAAEARTEALWPNYSDNVAAISVSARLSGFTAMFGSSLSYRWINYLERYQIQMRAPESGRNFPAFSRKVEFYLFLQGYAVPDLNGDPGIGPFGQWNLWTTITGSGIEAVTPVWGNATIQPTNVAIPPNRSPGDPDYDVTRGYNNLATAAIAKWNVGGGFDCTVTD